MKNMIVITKKIALGAGVLLMANMTFGQTLEEGIVNVDSHKYAKAKEIFNALIANEPKEGDNYFYLGNSYLSQFDPNFDTAAEYFKKGLEVDSKSYLNKIGLASIKIAKGDRSGISDIQKVVSDTREKDAEVLYRAAEALTMFEALNSPDLAIDYLNKAIERSRRGVPANYYYSLGDAYRLKKDPGSAMSAYEKASAVAKNKASVFTRMATLWMAANQWEQAETNINKALAVDPTYAPAYKASAAFNFRFRNNAAVTKNLIDYTKYADEDPYTQLEIAKLYFINDDYAKAKEVLNKIFDKVDDPIKYKLRAYLDYGADHNIASAQENLTKFVTTVTDKSRIQPADEGLQGLLYAAESAQTEDPAQKADLLAKAHQKIAIAKKAKDETMDWDVELIKAQGGGGANQAAADSGPTSPQIQSLKAKVAKNPQDAESLVALGAAYQEVQNWDGAVITWDRMIALSPEWAYSYYAKGVAYQQLGSHELAERAYQKYIDLVLSQTPEQQAQSKETLSYAYYLVAFYNQDKDLAKAKDYVAKAIQINPSYTDAISLQTALSEKE